jgi:protein ImuA
MSALLLDAIATLWRASDLGGGLNTHAVPTGFEALDAELPGGGWPAGQLSEIMQPPSGWREWRLLLPCLGPLSQQGFVLLVGPPWVPHLPALASQGLAVGSLRWVAARTAAERLWAAEQALRCRELVALLLWLPPGVGPCSTQALRRLHLAAQAGRQTRAPLLWAFRPWQALQQSSPAPLRVGLAAGAQDGLSVSIFKRRGHLPEQPLWLPAARPPALRARPSPAYLPASGLLPIRSSHVVDRFSAAPVL